MTSRVASPFPFLQRLADAKHGNERRDGRPRANLRATSSSLSAYSARRSEWPTIT